MNKLRYFLAVFSTFMLMTATHVDAAEQIEATNSQNYQNSDAESIEQQDSSSDNSDTYREAQTDIESQSETVNTISVDTTDDVSAEAQISNEGLSSFEETPPQKINIQISDDEEQNHPSYIEPEDADKTNQTTTDYQDKGVEKFEMTTENEATIEKASSENTPNMAYLMIFCAINIILLLGLIFFFVKNQKLSARNQELFKENKLLKSQLEDHTMILKLSSELARIQTNLSKMDPSTKGHKQLVSAAERIEKIFSENGYELISLIGQEYNSGFNCDADFVIDESMPAGKAVITGMLRHQVNYQGKMIQAPKIIVTQSSEQ